MTEENMEVSFATKIYQFSTATFSDKGTVPPKEGQLAYLLIALLHDILTQLPWMSTYYCLKKSASKNCAALTTPDDLAGNFNKCPSQILDWIYLAFMYKF